MALDSLLLKLLLRLFVEGTHLLLNLVKTPPRVGRPDGILFFACDPAPLVYFFNLLKPSRDHFFIECHTRFRTSRQIVALRPGKLDRDTRPFHEPNKPRTNEPNPNRTPNGTSPSPKT